MPKINLICSYHICAAHQLKRDDWSEEKNREVYGHCARVHGHQYKMDLVLSDDINEETHMLINGYSVDSIVKPFLEENFDHHFLNTDVEFFKTHQPTAEWIAVWVYDCLKTKFPAGVELNQVKIFETPELVVCYP